jgi:hypothetical protein
MTKNSISDFTFSGKVAAVFDEFGKQKVKILISPGYLEIILDANEDINLGDIVQIDSGLLIRDIKRSISQMPAEN